MNHKKLVSILTTTAIISTLLGTMFFAAFTVSAATTFTTNGVTVDGVLASDSYVLYPYETDANLVLGISKYGELINGEATPAQGLEYDGMDVFANPNVLERDWSQGWLIDIHYVDVNDNYKRAWAFAMYTDLTDSNGIGGDWKEACTGGPNTTPTQGGRKTNVWATSDPIKVLYDGPRRFVALTKTTIYGASGKTADDALVSVTITFVFNKDKKCVILYKDIKRLDEGKFTRKFQVEFSNRGEWDIGTTSAPPAYGHFHDNLATVYDYEYHEFYSSETNATHQSITGFDVAQMINQAGTYVGFAAFWPQLYGKMIEGTTTITRDVILQSLCTVEKNDTWLALGSTNPLSFASVGLPDADPYLTGLGATTDAPMVFKNGVLMTSGYTWNSPNEIDFTVEPLDTDVITIIYKHEVNPDIDNMTSEPDTPYVIGEWVFDLRNEDHKKMFRGVTVYGLMDRHDADDDDADAETWPGADGDANTIDSEVQYYLDETFNPYDLYSAVHKQESRWVDFTTVALPGTTSTVQLTEALDDPLYYAVLTSELSALGFATPGWTGYFIKEGGGASNATAESTWVNNFEDGADSAHSKNWALLLTSSTSTTEPSDDDYEMLKVTPQATTGTTTAPLTLQLKDLVDFGFWYKFISGTYGPHIEIKVSSTPAGGEGANWANLASEMSNPTKATDWTNHFTLNNIEDFIGEPTADTAFFATGQSGTPVTAGEKHSFEYFTAEDQLGNYYVNSIGVQVDDGASAYIDDLSVAYIDKASGIRYERVYNMEEDKLIPSDWDQYCSFSEKVLVNGVLSTRVTSFTAPPSTSQYTVNFETGLITFGTTLPAGTNIVKVLYSTIEENEKGRYEWMVVGKEAATIDSIGAGYMTEAFDSIKDIAVTKTGLDIRDMTGPNAPYVMAGATTGTREDYYFNYPTDKRAGLHDDWCHTIPVSSSNMLFAGGPIANLGAEYFNDFTMGFYPMGQFVTNDTGHADKVMALSCWDRNVYATNTTHGYGVISVYKDLNGTIGFLIWGMHAQDTYFTTNWFWSYPAGITCPDGTVVYSGIEYLQHENLGVTDLILRIYYPPADPIHPTVSIIEKLGTISEKPQHDCPAPDLT
jgi:hypothetical protein